MAAIFRGLNVLTLHDLVMHKYIQEPYLGKGRTRVILNFTTHLFLYIKTILEHPDFTENAITQLYGS